MKKRDTVKVATLGFQQLAHPVKHGAEAVEAMKKHLEFQLSFVLPQHPDLILFPEACDRYSSHTMPERRNYYAERGEKIREFLVGVARDNNCYIGYSAARPRAEGGFFNTTELIGRDGSTAAEYHKNNCVVTEISNGHIHPGDGPVTVDTEFGRIGFAICFDLNFNEFRQQYRVLRPDLMLFSSMYHGGVVQNFWAYDLNCFLVSAVGGQQSGVLDPVGERIASSTNYSPYASARINLDFEAVHLDFNWDKLQAARVKYGEKISIVDRGNTGVVILYSNTGEFTSSDVCREFEIELWRDYYRRSRAANEECVSQARP